MDPITILAAFGPLVVDLGKSLISRFVAPDELKPANVDEYIKMRECDLGMFKAMNDVGVVPSRFAWVDAIIALQRPAVAAIVLLTWGYLTIQGQSSSAVDNFCAAIGFYLYGDRTLFHAKAAATKK